MLREWEKSDDRQSSEVTAGLSPTKTIAKSNFAYFRLYDRLQSLVWSLLALYLEKYIIPL